MSLVKISVVSLGVSSIMVLSGTISDLRKNSTDFMNDNEIQVVRRLDDSRARKVASANSIVKNIEKVFYNSSDVNGTWTITRALDLNSDEEVLEGEFTGELEMLNGSADIVIGKDEFGKAVETYEIKFLKKLPGAITIAFTNGSGIMFEAKKVLEVEALENEEKVEVESLEGLTVEEEVSLTLKSAKKSGALIEAAGELEISFVEFNGKKVPTIKSIYVNTNNSNVDYSDLEVKHAGVFAVEGGEISGKLVNNGSKNDYRVEFFSGDLKGIILEFTSQDDMDAVEYDNYLVQEIKDEQLANNPELVENNPELAGEPESEIEILTEEEIRNRVNNGGFSFSQAN